MFRVAVICAVLAYVSAQDYACEPASYCTSSGYDRINEMGCQYFCYMDKEDPKGSLTSSEFHLAYADWKGAAAECDLACFTAAQKRIIPRACDSEIVGTYDILAAFDGNEATISGVDIQEWYDYVQALDPTSSVISPKNFQTFWSLLYARVGDDNCPNKLG